MICQAHRKAGLISLGFLFVAACSTPPLPTPTVPTIEQINPCLLITEQELQRWDVTSQSEPVDMVGETGCQWEAPLRSIALVKAKDGLDFFDKKKGLFFNYEKNSVNGRPGRRFQISYTNTECSQVMAAGTGYVSVDITYKRPSQIGPDRRYPDDPCGEALAIATVIEPRLP